MKTAAKIFIILGMVVGFWYILPLIFGGIALSQMSKGKPSTGISICVLLFCNTIGGILLLCSKDSDYVPAYNPQMNGYNPQMNGYNPQMNGYNPQQGYNPNAQQGYNPNAQNGFNNQQNNFNNPQQ